jgi:OmcA/MtrC family decaheme c-type cytochrome
MKKSFHGLAALILLVAFIAAGCQGDDTNPAAGQNGIVSSQSQVAGASPDGLCTNGYIEVKTGIDTNSNGSLDSGEVDLTQYVCNGTNGADGAKGDTGGAGGTGSDGDEALVSITTEAAGDNCANVGSKVEAGLDADKDGTLDAGEVTSTGYICNGADLNAEATPESCSVCHSGVGDEHQARYDELYQHGVLVVSNMTYTNDGASDIVTFKMTKSGANFDCTQADALGVYFTAWDGATFPWDQSIKGTLTYDSATNVCTSTKAQVVAKGDLAQYDGLIVVYGTDEVVEYISALHMNRAKYPFSAMLETKGAVTYSSAANVSGCEKCHTVPFLKHAYIYGNNGNVAGQDFWTCKACHYDTRTGGHTDWQVLVDNPVRYTEIGTTPLTTEEKAKYAYKARLMNDVHMSHAMEFAYPQSMANCATCHEGKLTQTLDNANFTLTTCRSCHPVTADVNQAEKDGHREDGTESKRAPALKDIMPASYHSGLYANLYADTPDDNCLTCHGVLSNAPNFNEIHTGYNTKIYADAAGTKYSEVFTTSIDAASLLDSALTITFSATKTGTLTAFVAADIVPSVYVALYGYDTKHFIARVSGAEVSAADGEWVYTADLSDYADQIADGTVKRAEIAVLPKLGTVVGEVDSHGGESDDIVYALNAPSRTFDLGANAFVDYYSPIVDVNKCNNCHDALATTFHTPVRGGNVTVCRMCHVTTSGGSHLEMQSRSIDSYVHAIHSFQPFDIGDVDFTDAVEALHYEHHVESHFPTFNIENCESCHNPGTYNVPDQSKSLPGLHSKSDTVADRSIGTVPGYVTGPASRACGGCHRAELINEDDAAGLAAFNQHTAAGGYLLEVPATPSTAGTDLLNTVIETIMSIFN